MQPQSCAGNRPIFKKGRKYIRGDKMPFPSRPLMRGNVECAGKRLPAPQVRPIAAQADQRFEEASWLFGIWVVAAGQRDAGGKSGGARQWPRASGKRGGRLPAEDRGSDAKPSAWQTGGPRQGGNAAMLLSARLGSANRHLN